MLAILLISIKATIYIVSPIFLAICHHFKNPNFSTHAGDYSCTAEVQRAIPILKKAYGDSMHKILHVGPDTCSVVSKLLKEEETEAWGVEPYDIEDADTNCKALVRKGIVRVADIKFPLPYRPKSFSLVIVSDALDYLSPRYLNKTLPDLARVSADGLAIFAGKSPIEVYPLSHFSSWVLEFGFKLFSHSQYFLMQSVTRSKLFFPLY